MEKLKSDYKISFIRGDTYALAVKFKNITEDLRLAFFTVKENPSDTPLIQKSLGAGIDKIEDRAYKNEKTYKIQLQPIDTLNLEARVQYLYDLQVTIGNVVKTVLSGVFTLNHTVTGTDGATSETINEVAIDDEVEVEALATPATNGIEYESDPVALGKIGDMATLATTAKATLVQAISEVKGNTTTNAGEINKIKNGTIVLPQAKDASEKIGGKTISQIFEKDGTTARKATVALYASEDTSKGTIEERLSKMGFSEGSIALTEEVSYFATQNELKRQGNYVIGTLSFDTLIITGAGQVIGNIPAEFRPKEDITIYPVAQINNGIMYVSGLLTITIATSGDITIGTFSGDAFVTTNGNHGSVEDEDLKGYTANLFFLYLGYETNSR